LIYDVTLTDLVIAAYGLVIPKYLQHLQVGAHTDENDRERSYENRGNRDKKRFIKSSPDRSHFVIRDTHDVCPINSLIITFACELRFRTGLDIYEESRR